MVSKVPQKLPLTLKQLGALCYQRISEAHQAVSDARRVAEEKRIIQDECRRLHEGRDLHR